MAKRSNWVDILVGGTAIVGTGLIVKHIIDSIYKNGYSDGYSKGYNQGYYVAKTEAQRQIAELRTETATALKIVESRFEKRIQELDANTTMRVRRILSETIEEALRKQTVMQASRPSYNV